MDDGKTGYIPIFRKFFDHYLWEEKREFSKAEAWIDCIQLARYKDNKQKKLIAGNLIEWGYGEFPASIRFLKQRWGWGSNTKVEKFLKLLEDDKMIVVKKGQGQNVITLCNYKSYDISKLPQKDTERTQKGQTEDTERTERGQNSKKGNKGKKGEEYIYHPLISDFSNILKMEEPLTIEQGESLIEKFGENQVKGILMRMENYKPLNKKNKSAYLTANNWLQRNGVSGSTNNTKYYQDELHTFG